ncbi:MAG: amino acid ABC transporter substrate-binding protein [Oscillospiraceae bacterium]|nr:amino acid ABC transporter substrate-binding protein [Oscillospiraceae bacterium]
MSRFITLLLALTFIFALCCLSGCGSTDEATPADTAEPAETADAAEPAEGGDAAEVPLTINNGVLTMGTNAAFPPYEFYDGDTIVGIDAEIAALIAEKLGLTLEIVDMDFSSIITSVQTGKIDMGMAGMTVTEERLQNVNFATSYATGIQVIIVPDGSPITSADDLTAMAENGDEFLIGTQEATTGFLYASDDFGEDHVVAYTNGAMAVQALTEGKVDCVIIDNEPAKNFVAANEGLSILDSSYVTEDYAIAVSKDNEALLDAINQAIGELIDDGSVQAVLDKYIGA